MAGQSTRARRLVQVAVFGSAVMDGMEREGMLGKVLVREIAYTVLYRMMYGVMEQRWGREEWALEVAVGFAVRCGAA